MKRLFAIAFFLMMATLTPTYAVQPDEVLADPALEARARVLSQELRCLVCQNQSIDDSDAALARDLRILLRERLKSGDSDQQVLDFIVARYTEFVLLRPRVNAHTVLLWLAPPLLLLAGAVALFAALRRRGRADLAETPLTPEEKARLQRVNDPA
jgi:cytochrome c-type biogenesis protein CcmH